jgi:hypothetical protein
MSAKTPPTRVGERLGAGDGVVGRAAPVGDGQAHGIDEESAEQKDGFAAADRASPGHGDQRGAGGEQSAAVAQDDFGRARHRLDQGAEAEDEEQVDQRGADDGAEDDVGQVRGGGGGGDGEDRRGGPK